jgi:hypothetical protein
MQTRSNQRAAMHSRMNRQMLEPVIVKANYPTWCSKSTAVAHLHQYPITL